MSVSFGFVWATLRIRTRRRKLLLMAEEAFAYMEEAKSRSLRGLLFGCLRAFSSSDSESGSDSGSGDLQRRVRDLRRELNWYYGRIEAAQLSREAMNPEKIRQL